MYLGGQSREQEQDPERDDDRWPHQLARPATSALANIAARTEQSPISGEEPDPEADQEQRAAEELAEIRQQLAVNAQLQDREYAFCLYPADKLRRLMASLWPAGQAGVNAMA